jgi:hypothetical protein
MKLAGLLMLVAGWAIVVAAMVMLPAQTVRAVFVLAGVAVEGLGLVLAARAHLPQPEGRREEPGRRD